MNIRRALRADVPAIVSIYRLDPLTGPREIAGEGLPEMYFHAFDRIDADPNQLLLVAEDGASVVGTVQVTFIQHLMAQAHRRAIIEAVFVHRDHAGKGIGSALIRSAVQAATDAGCKIVSLTSNKARPRAHEFYAKLGFHPTHEGFKLLLTPQS